MTHFKRDGAHWFCIGRQVLSAQYAREGWWIDDNSGLRLRMHISLDTFNTRKIWGLHLIIFGLRIAWYRALSQPQPGTGQFAHLSCPE